MGLFQKKVIEHNLNFSLKNKKTILVAGLGNIGKDYSATRHNIGFDCLDAFKETQSEFEPWQEKKSLFCNLSSGTFGTTKVLLIKPTTFMNESGKSVQAVMAYYKIPTSNVVVVHDDLDIAFGQIKTKTGGGSAGHNGIKSITSHIGEAYGRVRVGIMGKKPEQIDTSDYVLAKFSILEQKDISKLTREVSSILIELIYRGELYPETRNFLL